MRNNNTPSVVTLCKSMHDLYIAEIYRADAIFLSLTVWVYSVLSFYFTQRTLEKAICVKLMRLSRSRCQPIADVQVPCQWPIITQVVSYTVCEILRCKVGNRRFLSVVIHHSLIQSSRKGCFPVTSGWKLV